MTDGIEREIGEIKTHLEYIKTGMDEIRAFLKDCPDHRQQVNQLVRDQRKANWRNRVILGGLASFIGASWREIIHLVTGK